MSRRWRRRPAPRASRSGGSCSSMGPPRPLLSSASAARANLALRHDGTGGGGISAACMRARRSRHRPLRSPPPMGPSKHPALRELEHLPQPWLASTRPQITRAWLLLCCNVSAFPSIPTLLACAQCLPTPPHPTAGSALICSSRAQLLATPRADDSEKARTHRLPRSACSRFAPDPHAAHLRRCRSTEAVDEGRCERRGGDAEGEECAEGVVLRTAVEERRLVRKNSGAGGGHGGARAGCAGAQGVQRRS
jgi:hypothetical protein